MSYIYKILKMFLMHKYPEKDVNLDLENFRLVKCIKVLI